MLKNPFFNAFLAVFYIALIVFVLGDFDGLAKNHQSLLVPMTILSLLVLSVAVMGVLFVYIPAKMYLDNQREAAIVFFSKTLGTFACIALIFVLLQLLL